MGFTWYDSYTQALDLLPEADKAVFVLGIIAYAEHGEEPNFGYPLSLAWPSIKESIDTQRKRHRGERKRKKLSDKHRFMVLERDGFKCVYCGRGAEEVELEVDHYMPLSKGGADNMSNYVTACRDCNSGKRVHVIGEERGWN